MTTELAAISAALSAGAKANAEKWDALGRKQGPEAKFLLPGLWHNAPSDWYARDLDTDPFWKTYQQLDSAYDGLSPVFAFPMFPWSFGADGKATADYDVAAGNHFSWWATPDGKWGATHTVTKNVGQVLDQVVSAISVALEATGWVFAGAFLQTLQAAAEKRPIGQLGQALKSDYQILADEGTMAFSLLDGEWGQAWDAATDYGRNLEGLLAEWGPGLAPDRDGNLTIGGATPQKASKNVATETIVPIQTGKVPTAKGAAALQSYAAQTAKGSSSSSSSSTGLVLAIVGAAAVAWLVLK